VLAGYVGIACGLFAGNLAYATFNVFVVFIDPDDHVVDSVLLFLFAVGLFIGGLSWAFEELKVPIRFSRLLRRPGDPRAATVTASKRGGHTLILDIPREGTGRGYQSLSRVRLALWTKADMLVPGETVNVYGGQAARANCSSAATDGAGHS
jgi:hypothetical protein